MPSWASDGYCDDGGPGAEYSACMVGTDCTDCGERTADDIPSPSPDPTEDMPPPAAPAVCAGDCIADSTGEPHTCEFWEFEHPDHYTCSFLESAWACSCSGCICRCNPCFRRCASPRDD